MKMTNGDFSRRSMLSLIAGGTASLTLSAPAIAQSSGQGLLDKLRKAGVVKVAITNDMPYAHLNPDGTVDGVAATITKLCIERMGIAKMEPIVATYGELVPGLQAGRWDIIGADMTITKARCEQVSYIDPYTIDSAAFAYVPGAIKDPPKTLKDVGQSTFKIGMLRGTYMLPIVKGKGVKEENIVIFPDIQGELQGLLQKRIDIAFAGSTSLKQMRAQQNNAFTVVHPIPDDVLHGASAAVRKTDTDVLDAFNAEYRKMKKSGEAKAIIEKFGWEVLPGHTEMTGEKACTESLI